MAQNVRNGQNMVVVSEAKTRKNYKCQIFWDLVVFSNVMQNKRSSMNV